MAMGRVVQVQKARVQLQRVSLLQCTFIVLQYICTICHVSLQYNFKNACLTKCFVCDHLDNVSTHLSLLMQ